MTHVTPIDCICHCPLQATNGYRAESFLENLNQKTVENNTKLYDVEDSTRSYRSPLSFW